MRRTACEPDEAQGIHGMAENDTVPPFMQALHPTTEESFTPAHSSRFMPGTIEQNSPTIRMVSGLVGYHSATRCSAPAAGMTWTGCQRRIQASPFGSIMSIPKASKRKQGREQRKSVADLAPPVKAADLQGRLRPSSATFRGPFRKVQIKFIVQRLANLL